VRAGEIRTVVGQGLFDFGHMDGPAAQALLQHPLGVCALPDGSVLVADTYNGAVRRYDPAGDAVSTVVADLAEPSDIVALPDGALLVVESAAHRLTRLPADTTGSVPAPERPTGTRHRVERPPVRLAPGDVVLDVVFTPAPGQKLDDSAGRPIRLEVSASPPDLLVAGTGTGTDLRRELTLSSTTEGGVLQVVAQAATCDVDAAHPACHLTRQDWGVPVVVVPDGADRLPLVLRGLEP
jgi:hypothetical protein